MNRYKMLILQILLMPVMPILFKSKAAAIMPSAAEQANAATAVDSWNHYVEALRPATMEYIADVRSDTAPKEAIAEGMANADLQQKLSQKVNPGASPVAGDMNKFAKVKSASDLNVAAGVQNQHASELQQVLDAGSGREVSAQKGMADLAKMATEQAITDNQTAYNERATTGRTVAGGLGMAAGYTKQGLTAPKTGVVDLTGRNYQGYPADYFQADP